MIRRPDLRGVAIRVSTEQGDHDFLMTNAEPHHARDAREAMVTIMAGTKKDAVEDLLGEAIGKGAFFVYLLLHLGLKTARRIADTLKVQTEREVKSLATETYWSRAPIAIGKVPDPEQSVAVKYRLEPLIDRPDLPGDSHNLGQEFKTRISQGGITFLRCNVTSPLAQHLSRMPLYLGHRISRRLRNSSFHRTPT